MDLFIPAPLRIGDVVCTSVLRSAGASSEHIRSWVRVGQLTRLRRGWYALPGADADVARAVRTGGILGCASALTFHGAWRLTDGRLHVYRADWAHRETTPKVLSCPAPWPRVASDRGVVPIELAVEQARRCLSTEAVVTQVESMVNGRWITRGEAERLLGDLATKLDVSDSGTETMVRLRLRALGIKLRPQVYIEGVGRVDFLIGDRLVVEVDSHRHHRSTRAYHEDRRRDQLLVALGYIVMRVTWEDVVLDWATAQERILSVIRARRHLTRRAA